MESIQLLNTAIIKSKEKNIDHSFESRLSELCKYPALDAINKTISSLAESEGITRDQAAVQIVEAIRELDSIWNDYVIIEGIDRLKNILKNSSH